MKRTTFLFLLFLARLLVGLVFMARQGDIWAASILAALWTMLAATFGAFIVLYVTRQRDIKQNADFAANVKENILIMQQLQRLQNEQGKGLMQISKYPQQQTQNGLLIEDSIFDELD